MRLQSVREALEGLSEEELQDLVRSAYENDGWIVSNLHKEDPGHENGADLICEKDEMRHLLAVKMRPAKKDIDQLNRLRKRSTEGALFYVYARNPTASFEEERKRVKDQVSFLGPPELHLIFLKHEVIDYLVMYFATLPITKELAESVTILWQSRKVVIPGVTREPEDFVSIYSLKDAVLKTRAALGVVAIQWDAGLMNRTDISTNDYDSILDEVVGDLDAIQRFTGGNLSDAFDSVYRRTPHVLSMIWKVVRIRTDWNHFALVAERIDSRDQVYELAKWLWALPGAASFIPHSKINRDRMRFFYSGLIGILNNLATVAKDLDDGVDWAWQDGFSEHSPKE